MCYVGRLSVLQVVKWLDFLVVPLLVFSMVVSVCAVVRRFVVLIPTLLIVLVVCLVV